jgi:hypothetical protein
MVLKKLFYKRRIVGRPSLMARAKFPGDDPFEPVTVLIKPGQDQTLSFAEHSAFLCQFTTGRRTDPEAKCKIELFAELNEGEPQGRKVKWLEFAEGDSALRDVHFFINPESGVTYPITGDSGIILESEFVPSFDDLEEDGDD